MTTITLTEEQRANIKNGMDNQVEMLTDEEVEALATKLNERIDIPFIKEGTEQIIFVKIVRNFDRLLYANLPNELYGLVKNASDGLSDNDADEMAEVLAKRLNAKFDIPYVPEFVEKEIFELLIDLIVTAMRKKFAIINE